MESVHADKWGPIGSIIAALCCLGFAPLLAALTALGLGFLIHDLILFPLLVFFLGISIWALDRDRPRHGLWQPEGAAAVAAVLTLGGLFFSPLIVAAGLILLVGASVWNWLLIRRLTIKEASSL